ncbi:hypothetical protein MJA45_04855 [Paenibacillus aurantius]|uniref:Uncharacterized protein n=1 Tax=Paenibacillus aurantius TaxID=2918900 RepID=A0AA96LEL4_9BACL|nr:hypothetical protein [Paenibacillus aurantius]WNQ12382.1 hypothetical protein MJA45_04855 [Paenibacillus aurantius]
MEVTIMDAKMTKDEESGYVGQVVFQLPGERNVYELTLQSKKARDWGYSLHFAKESGTEEELEAMEERLEEDDELFDRLVGEAMSRLQD